MRGKLRKANQIFLDMRNIPAYAGKTCLVGEPNPQNQEHPRVCGENLTDVAQGFLDAGTSPRMRGKLIGSITSPTPGRNIPAYAGKTVCAAVIRSRIAEHPRVCGENRFFLNHIA